MQVREAVFSFIAAAALAISSWSLVTTVGLTNSVTQLREGKADKETVYELRETQAVLAEAFKNQTLILAEIKEDLKRGR